MKITTRDKLLDAAEELFAERGFAGASFRAVTSAAEANLGAVHYHFGSKKQLFAEVVHRRIRPLSQARLSRLNALERSAADADLPLRGVIEAFVRPVLDVLLTGPQAACWMRLIGWCRVEPGDHWSCLEEELQETYRRFKAAFRRALAEFDLPDAEIDYRLYFFLGAEVNTLTDLHGLRTIDPKLPTVYEDPDGVIARLVDFASAGMSAPQLRHRTVETPEASS